MTLSSSHCMTGCSSQSSCSFGQDDSPCLARFRASAIACCTLVTVGGQQELPPLGQRLPGQVLAAVPQIVGGREGQRRQGRVEVGQLEVGFGRLDLVERRPDEGQIVGVERRHLAPAVLGRRHRIAAQQQVEEALVLGVASGRICSGFCPADRPASTWSSSCLAS